MPGPRGRAGELQRQGAEARRRVSWRAVAHNPAAPADGGHFLHQVDGLDLLQHVALSGDEGHLAAPLLGADRTDVKQFKHKNEPPEPIHRVQDDFVGVGKRSVGPLATEEEERECSIREEEDELQPLSQGELERDDLLGRDLVEGHEVQGEAEGAGKVQAKGEVRFHCGVALSKHVRQIVLAHKVRQAWWRGWERERERRRWKQYLVVVLVKVRSRCILLARASRHSQQLPLSITK